MPTYRVTAPDGRKFRLTGDSPPTEQELEEIFGKMTPTAAPAEPPDTSGQPSTFSQWQHGLGVGGAKGIMNTVAGLGDIFNAAGAKLGIGNRDAAAFEAVRAMNRPTTTPERVGMGLEQAAEFVGVPGPGKVRGAKLALGMARTGAANVGLARAQGATEGEAAAAGVLGAVPVAAGMAAAGKWLGDKAKPLIRAALKPTVAAMKRVAGASVEGIDAKAGQLVSFILENRVTTAEKARTIFAEAERELQRILSVKNAPTDAPQRAIRYLEALEKSAAKQALPAEDVALIRKAAGEVFEGGLGQDAEAFRVLRTDVGAAEALERARANAKWDTRKSWGEQKGASKEASKAIERALRDSVKAAVPEAAPILKREGLSLRTAEALDRAEFRAANRDAVSLPAHVVAAGELASGRPPVLAFAANWLRNNQLKAGIYADTLSKAIERGDTGRVVSIMHRLGVGIAPRLLSAAPAGP